MELNTFNFATFHNFGSTYYDYLGLRKRHFVDALNWSIPHDDKVEMDQYDNPLAYYSVVTRNGKVIGGARTAPTSAEWGETTYMLKDAAAGRLPKIPSEVFQDVFETNKIWECTRLVVSDSLTTFQERNQCLGLIVDGLAYQAEQNGAQKLISLSPVTLTRALRSFGYPCERIGDIYTCQDDGRKYAVLTMPTTKTLIEEIPAAA